MFVLNICLAAGRGLDTLFTLYRRRKRRLYENWPLECVWTTSGWHREKEHVSWRKCECVERDVRASLLYYQEQHMLRLNTNRPETSKYVNIKDLGSKVVPFHALKAYRWSRSIAPSIGEPRIFLGGGRWLTLRPKFFWGGMLTLSPELFGGGWPWGCL
jgi:hypothetical protein